jgi:hypothetical protein
MVIAIIVPMKKAIYKAFGVSQYLRKPIDILKIRVILWLAKQALEK